MSRTAHDWRAEAIAADAAGATAYLEHVAAMPLLRAVAERVLDALRLVPGQRVLDVGCGSGVFLPPLADRVGPTGHVIGVDRAPAMIAAAGSRTEHFANTTVQQADAYELPFSNNTFDAAHCERVLMHLERPLIALLEMRRVVRPGGWIVAAEPDWGGLQMDSRDAEAARLLLSAWIGGLAQPRMGLQLYRHFGEAGLTDLRGIPIVPGVTDYAELLAYGLDLEHAAGELDAAQVLNRDRSEAVLSEWRCTSSQGRFFGYIGMFVVAGRVPDGRFRGE
jgi:SAM-dependent methyltransferase